MSQHAAQCTFSCAVIVASCDLVGGYSSSEVVVECECCWLAFAKFWQLAVLKAPVVGGVVLELRARRLVVAEVRPDFNTLSSERHDLRYLWPGCSGRFLERKFPSANADKSGRNGQLAVVEAFLSLCSLLEAGICHPKRKLFTPTAESAGEETEFKKTTEAGGRVFLWSTTRRLDIDNSGRFFVSEISLQIADVGPQDQGIYQCVIRNAQSGQSFRGHPVPVHLSTSPATIQAVLLYPLAGVSLLRARLSDNVTLQCFIGSVAASRIVWVELNDNLCTLAGIRTRLGNLLLSNVSSAHHGSHACQSRQASASYALQVQSPLFVRLRLVVSRLEDDSWFSDLVCYTHGDRSTTLSWFYNGRPLLDADLITAHWSVQRRGRNPRWTANISPPPPPGVYQCVATSGDESTTDSIYVSKWPSTTRRRSATNAHWSKLIRVGPTNNTVKLNLTTFLLCQLHSPRATISWWQAETRLEKVIGRLRLVSDPPV
ncbi:Immunoglobulin superfamily DCC subclass member 3 [Trichinella murrelli]|uniref:Immunoglobulin superfamily DCC subclass member 3 n=1 Tax=Trichinella murrelli TaxID=144512 RepID=A0A0V0T514_9BILA|nr:Immunoglobulin superfamily DCC subclass member 3 [Trichinella murrelli]